MAEISSFFHINLDASDKLPRYGLEKFLQLVNGNYDPLTSSLLFNLQKMQPGGKIRVEGEEGRPDQLSQKAYGETQYWWIIMFYNGLTSVEEIENGMELNYPRLDELEDFYFQLKFNQDTE